jgi:hypothetical protein
MNSPDDVSKMTVLGAPVAYEESLKAKVSDHSNDKENGRYDADYAKIIRFEQSGKQHRTYGADN